MTKYHYPFIKEYVGNPLIEALPEIIENKKLIKKLGHFPDYDEAERNWPPHLRRHVVSRLNRMRAPLPEYIEVFRMLEQALFESYLPKNPFSPTTANWLHQLNHPDAGYFPRTGLFQSNAQGMTVVGISGLGKTSMILQLMGYFGDVILHEEYKGNPLKFVQIPMIYVKCSHDTSLSGFCESIITQLSVRLGDPQKCAATIGKMINQIQSLVRRSFLGMLVVDDLQNMKIEKTGGKENFVNFLLNLIDDAGVPILFISNPEGKAILEEKFRISRRVEKLGYIEMSVMDKEVWDKCFIKSMWRYQWTTKPTECSPELNECLFNLSRGIVDIAIRVYMMAQRLVIGTDDETITCAVLEHAFRKVCVLTASGLQLLDSENGGINDFEDLQLPSPDKPMVSGQPYVELDKVSTSQVPLAPALSRTEKNKQVEVIGDLNRIHHPEFKSDLTELAGKSLSAGRIRNFDVIRNCRLAQDPYEALAQQKYVTSDPTKLL